jgi:4-amino-4-deoxy-L-arabinose transferase-like glycosyltransferase
MVEPDPMMAGHRRSQTLRGLLWGIVILGMLLRFAVALRVAPYPERYSARDPYQELAWSLLAGRGFVAPGQDLPVTPFTPGYPLFLAGIFAATGGSALAALLANAILACLTIGLVFAIGVRLLGPRGGLVAAALYALDWISIGYVGQLNSETLGTMLLVLGVWLWVRCLREDRPVLPLLCGAALGAATLVRVAMLLPVVVLLAAGFWMLRRSPLRLGAMSLAVLALCLPWCVRNQLVFGRLELSSAGPYNIAVLWVGPARSLSQGQVARARLDVWQADLDHAYPGWRDWDPYRQAEAAAALSLQWARAHPWTVIKYVAHGFVGSLLGPGQGVFESLVGPAPAALYRAYRILGVLWALGVASLAAVGLVRSVRGRRESLVWLAFASAALAMVVAPGSAGHGRFRVPAVPLMAMLAAASVTTCARQQAPRDT